MDLGSETQAFNMYAWIMQLMAEVNMVNLLWARDFIFIFWNAFSTVFIAL